MQRRIEQANSDWKSVHRFKNANEVLALQWQKRIERLLLLLVAVGENQSFNVLLTLAEEHVLGAAQSDALSPHPASAGSIVGGVGIGTHTKSTHCVGTRDESING